MTKLFTKVQNAVDARLNDEEGAGMVEYGLLVTGIAIIAMVGIKAFGGELNSFFSGLGNQIGM